MAKSLSTNRLSPVFPQAEVSSQEQSGLREESVRVRFVQWSLPAWEGWRTSSV